MAVPVTTMRSNRSRGLRNSGLHGAVNISRRRCASCVFARRCLPASLSQAELNRFERVMPCSRTVRAGQHLFREGDSFHAMFALQNGCFKSYRVDAEGREHVLNFHFAGECIGVDAIYPERHVSNAVALVDSLVCYLPFQAVTEMAHEMPELQRQLFRLLSRDVFSMASIAGDYTAEERLAAFLVMVSARLRTHGRSPRDLQLAMSRQDIANYLRLATETVSRILARFQKTGLLRVERKHVMLLDPDGLKEIAQCMNPYGHRYADASQSSRGAARAAG